METEWVLIELNAKIWLRVTETASHSGAELGSVWFTLHTGNDVGLSVRSGRAILLGKRG